MNIGGDSIPRSCRNLEKHGLSFVGVMSSNIFFCVSSAEKGEFLRSLRGAVPAVDPNKVTISAKKSYPISEIIVALNKSQVRDVCVVSYGLEEPLLESDDGKLKLQPRSEWLAELAIGSTGGRFDVAAALDGVESETFYLGYPGGSSSARGVTMFDLGLPLQCVRALLLHMRRYPGDTKAENFKGVGFVGGGLHYGASAFRGQNFRVVECSSNAEAKLAYSDAVFREGGHSFEEGQMKSGVATGKIYNAGQQHQMASLKPKFGWDGIGAACKRPNSNQPRQQQRQGAVHTPPQAPPWGMLEDGSDEDEGREVTDEGPPPHSDEAEGREVTDEGPPPPPPLYPLPAPIAIPLAEPPQTSHGRSEIARRKRAWQADLDILSETIAHMENTKAQFKGGLRFEIQVAMGNPEGVFDTDAALNAGADAIRFLASSRSGASVVARISEQTAGRANKALLELARRSIASDAAPHLIRGVINMMGHYVSQHFSTRQWWRSGAPLRSFIAHASESGTLRAHSANAQDDALCLMLETQATVEPIVRLRIDDYPILRDLRRLLPGSGTVETFDRSVAQCYCMSAGLLAPSLEAALQGLSKVQPPEVSLENTLYRPSKQAVQERKRQQVYVAFASAPHDDGTYLRVPICVGTLEVCSFASELYASILVEARSLSKSVPETLQSRLAFKRGSGKRAARFEQMRGEENITRYAKEITRCPVAQICVWESLHSMNESVERQIDSVPASKELVDDAARALFLRYRDESTEEYRRFRSSVVLFLRARHVVWCRAQNKEPHPLFDVTRPEAVADRAYIASSPDYVAIRKAP